MLPPIPRSLTAPLRTLGAQMPAVIVTGPRQAGKLVLCGPFTDHAGGMIILRVKDKSEARAIAAKDPFVRDGVRSFEVRTWEIGNAENNYLGPDA